MKKVLCFALVLFLNIGWQWGSNYKSDGPDASDVEADTSNFDNNLSSTDDTVQKALNTLDELTSSVPETDPQVGTLTNTKWCTTDGSVVNCTANEPVLVEVDGSTTNEIEVVDEAYNSTNFNGGTTSATSQDDFYDFNHIADTDDDGLPNKVDLSSAGFVKTDASGGLSVDGNTYYKSGDTATFANVTDNGLTANTILSANASKVITSLATATYPSLTELSYVKGLTSSAQTQLNAKQATLVSGTNIKTVNSNSLLGSGDLAITSAPGGSTTQMQYNLSGVLMGSSNNVYADDYTSSTERITNGTFTGNATGWIYQAPAWGYSSNKLVKTAGQPGYCQQNSPNITVPVVGQKYRFLITIGDYSGSGTITPSIGGVNLPARSANGSYGADGTNDFIATTNQGLSLTTSTAVGLSIDNVSLKRITGTQTIQGKLAAEEYTLGNLDVFQTSSTPIPGTVFKGKGLRTWMAEIPGTGNYYADFQIINKGDFLTGNYIEWRVGYDSANNKQTMMTAGHGSTAGVPFVMQALPGQSTGTETLDQLVLLTDGKVLMSQTSSTGDEVLQVGGSISAQSTIGCAGTITDDCEDLFALGTSVCEMVAGCSLGSYACEGTIECSNFGDSECEGRGCSRNTICSGTHSPCENYGSDLCSVHGCTENWYDPMTCACGNAYCDNPACNGDPTGCVDPGVCSSFWHDDTMNCACGAIAWGGCSGSPHSCTTDECNASSDNCANTFVSCTGDPVACGQSDCDSSLYGCANVPYSCDGDPSDTDCDQISNAYCEDVNACLYADIVPALVLKNDTTSGTSSVSQDTYNQVYRAPSGGVHFFEETISYPDAIDRTAVYDKSQGPALDKIKDANALKKDGKIDHAAMYGYRTMKVQDRTSPVKVTKCVKEGKNKNTGESECQKYAQVNTYPHWIVVEGVSNSDRMAMFEQAIYELSEKDKTKSAEIETLKEELKKVKK